MIAVPLGVVGIVLLLVVPIPAALLDVLIIVNILLSLDRLVYEITLGDEVYEVEAPASIYIPAGLVHSANVIEGSGFFVAIIETADYVAKPPPAQAS